MEIGRESGTKSRLLQAARRVFAERGPKNATVREICDLAGANVAAVCYHFGSKEELYVAVLGDYMERAELLHPRDQGVTPASSPEDRLRVYVRSYLAQIVGQGDPIDELLGRRLAQEVIEPSRHFRELLDHHCRHAHQLLLDIVGQFLPGAGQATVSRCASSIIGQCLLFDFAREAITLMTPELELKASNIESSADFILEFALGGMERIRQGRPSRTDAP